jgi:hypothetical protein
LAPQFLLVAAVLLQESSAALTAAAADAFPHVKPVACLLTALT